jgi:hypothetical protein
MNTTDEFVMMNKTTSKRVAIGPFGTLVAMQVFLVAGNLTVVFLTASAVIHRGGAFPSIILSVQHVRNILCERSLFGQI